MIELLIFLNVICFLSAIALTNKNTILKSRIDLVNAKSNALEAKLRNKKYNINDKIFAINNISNSYQDYYELAISNLQKYDASKNLSKKSINDRINKIIDDENIKQNNRRSSSRTKSSDYSSSSSSSSSSYEDYLDFPTSSSSSSSSDYSSSSSDSYSGDGGSFSGGGSGGDW